MDLNGDKKLDILSGSYSRSGGSMAGLLHVLWGERKGFARAKPLDGTDQKPLILPGSGQDDDDLDRICTRAFAADLNGDDKLDLVVGNFRGTFGLFLGEGKGKFAPKASWLQAGGALMAVDSHGDPFLIDWDGDQDLDLLSGSAAGGVFLFVNEGTRQEPKFAKAITLLASVGHGGHQTEEVQFGDAAIQAPGADTRVWADDVDGDGQLDILIGDRASVTHPAKGLTEKAAREQLADWHKAQQKLTERRRPDMDEKEVEALNKEFRKLHDARGKIVRDESTGFVWWMRGNGKKRTD